MSIGLLLRVGVPQGEAMKRGRKYGKSTQESDQGAWEVREGYESTRYMGRFLGPKLSLIGTLEIIGLEMCIPSIEDCVYPRRDRLSNIIDMKECTTAARAGRARQDSELVSYGGMSDRNAR